MCDSYDISMNNMAVSPEMHVVITVSPAGQMWPRINAVATKRFHEFADPLIQQSKPSWVYHVEMQK